jgi:hypothetical protein
MRKRNPFGKRVEVTEAYATYEGRGWTYKVLKAYQHPDTAVKHRYTVWFAAVKSPYTHGSWEYGDTYIGDVLVTARLVDCVPEFKELYSTPAWQKFKEEYDQIGKVI